MTFTHRYKGATVGGLHSGAVCRIEGPGKVGNVIIRTADKRAWQVARSLVEPLR